MPDASDPLPESLREFLDAEKSCPDPPPEAQQRTLSRLSATLGLGGGLGDGLASSPPGESMTSHPVATRPSLSRVLARNSRRAWLTFLAGAAVGATVYGTAARFRQDPRPPNPSLTAPVAAPAEPMPVPEALPTEEVVPRPSPSVPNNGRGHGEPAPGRSKDVGLAAERSLVEIARTALARGRVDGALAILRRHARQYPKGQLGEERDSLLVQALVAKSDYPQARERATRFRRQHPSSLFLPAVDQALQSIP